MDRENERIPAEETFAACEALWKGPDARIEAERRYQEACAAFSDTVVVLDDDPTGVQTVHDVDVVTDWEVPILEEMLQARPKCFFILTNSRSFSAEKTAGVHARIAKNLTEASRRTGTPFLLISRGDSTLRGHYPLETRVLRETLEAEGHAPFAGEVLCPFFREGGRFTLNGIHYVREGTELVPCAKTEFSRDSTFGYTRSLLSGYIAEKSQGAVSEGEVVHLSLREIRSLDFSAMEKRILSAGSFRYITADSLEETDVKILFTLFCGLRGKGMDYLFRSAAAVPKVFGHVQDRPLLTKEEMSGGARDGGGLVMVGSHVRKTTVQLEKLHKSSLPLRMVEFRLDSWNEPGGLERETGRCARLAEEAMASGRTCVVYTSRELLAPEGMGPEELLDLSVRISRAFTDVVSTLSIRPRFLIAKGGITSSDVGTRALHVRRARVQGQAAPGVPVWKTGPESLFPGLSYIIFPGNVGNEDTLLKIVETLS